MRASGSRPEHYPPEPRYINSTWCCSFFPFDIHKNIDTAFDTTAMSTPFFASECQKIAELLEAGQYHDGQWGYVVYRCSYGDNDVWSEFMARLNDTVRGALDRAKDGHLIKDSFAWTIQDDQSRFEGASKAEIRQSVPLRRHAF